MMRRWTAFTGCAVALGLSVWAVRTTAAASRIATAQSIVQSAEKRAARQRKNVLVMYHATW